MEEERYRDAATLKQEVSKLEYRTQQAIESLETELCDLSQILVFEEEEWSPRLNTIDILTMEELPSLQKSIRRILVK